VTHWSLANRQAFGETQPNTFRDAIARFGDSLYLYDIAWLRGHLGRLRALLPREVEIIYSVKANPNPHLIRHIAPHVQGVEVSSEGELAQALEAGIEAGCILLVGPAKSREEIEFGVTRGVRAIVIESSGELDDIIAVCEARALPATLMVRVNPEFKSKGSRLTMSSASTQFGVEFDEAVSIVRTIQSCPWLKWGGIHVYTGTRILDASMIVENCRQILELAVRLGNAVDAVPPIIDFGGGLGVPYYDNETPLEVDVLGRSLDELVRGHRMAYPGTTYLIETGRYVVAECCIFLTAIRRIKKNKGSTWVLTAGGTNHFAAHTFMGALMRRNFPMEVVTRPQAPGDTIYNVCGPLCTPSDILASSVQLPALQPDDLIAIRNAGAYGYSNSALGFLSHTTPAEVALEGAELSLIRRAMGPDMLLDQVRVIDSNANNSNLVMSEIDNIP